MDQKGTNLLQKWTKFAQTQLWLFRLRGVLVRTRWRWPLARRAGVSLRAAGAAEVQSTGAPAGCPTPNASVSSLSPGDWRAEEHPNSSPDYSQQIHTSTVHQLYRAYIYTLQKQSSHILRW